MRKILLILLLLVFISFALLPFSWMFVTSLKTNRETYTNPPKWIPETITIENYQYISSKAMFSVYFRNTLIVALATTLFSLLLAFAAGYSFSRYQFPGKNFFLLAILATQMFPSVLLIIPLFQIMRNLRILNTLYALIFADVTFALPLCIWLMKSFYDQIPKELDEAALIDGCSQIGALIKVITPLVKPGIVACGVFSFIGAWDELVFALTFTSSEGIRTLSVALQRFVTAYEVYWNHLAAASVIATLPVVLMFLLIQKYLAKGAIVGAVKG